MSSNNGNSLPYNNVVNFNKSTPENSVKRPPYVIGPEGTALTIADLPRKDTVRWVVRRKAEVVAAVNGGMLTIEEACERYSLSKEEFMGWTKSIEKHGVLGLRSTKIQHYKAKNK